MHRRHTAILSIMLCVLAGCGSAAKEIDPRPNVLLILIDALRKDHLQLYGYGRSTSPTMDLLGKEGWAFENHIAHSTQTVPSVLSMMLSQYPVEHGFVHRYVGQFLRRPPHFPDHLMFLNEAFQEAGYSTAGFVANPFLTEENGFGQGYDHFQNPSSQNWWIDGEAMTNAAVKWLRSNADPYKPPIFLYVHYMDVHSPYKPPEEYAKKFPRPSDGRLLYIYGPARGIRKQDLEYTIAMYDACINYVDDQVARLVEVIRSRGLGGKTITVVTSDHGDEFLEHGGMGHSTTVYGELVRVPLIIRYPPKLPAGRRITHLSQHLDLAPTLLELAGIPAPPSFRGGNLLLQPAEAAYADTGPWRTVYAGGKKLVLDVRSGQTTLFDTSDELDQEPLDDPEAQKQLRKYLEFYRQLEEQTLAKTGPAPESTREWTEEELSVLRTLGYVQ